MFCFEVSAGGMCLPIVCSSCVCKDTQVNEIADNSCIGVFKTVMVPLKKEISVVRSESKVSNPMLQ